MSLCLDVSTARPAEGPFPGVEAEGLAPSRGAPPGVCEEHGEPLTMFCVDELLPVCQECGDTGSHAGHRVYAATEAVTDCKGELRTSTSKLQVKVIQLEKVIQTCEHASEHNQVQAWDTETQIKEEFEKLHQFLCEEEEARLTALREEEEKRKRGLKERRDGLTQGMKALQQKIKELEEEMEAEGDGVEFLQNFQDTIRSTWQSHKPEKVYGPLIDVAKYLGNLQFSVWDEMRYVAPYTPVTLDPRTASASLRLSPGLDSVRESSGASQNHEEDEDPYVSVPDNPERFHPYSSMLAREGYSSGTHCWDVLVGDCDSWTVGVASQSLPRREEFEPCPEAGLWAVSLREGEYRVMTTPPQILNRDCPLRRVRVTLDWDRGRLEFMDVDADDHVFTFTHRFTEKVYPYFESVSTHKGLSVLPYGVSMSTSADPPVAGEDHAGVNGWSNEGAAAGINGFIENEVISTDEAAKMNSPKKGKLVKRKIIQTKFNVTYPVSLNRGLKLREAQSAGKNQLGSHA